VLSSRAVKELNLIRYHLSNAPFLPIFCFISANLQPAFHRRQAALFNVVGNVLGDLLPADYPDKIRLALSLLVWHWAINCQIESGDCRAVWGISELRVTGKPTD
jgi:hypothetical protein